MKNKSVSKDFFWMLMFFGILVRIIFIFVFKGHSDPWNAESFNEYLMDGQIPFGPPYLPTNFLIPNIFGWFVERVGLFYTFWSRLADILADIGISFLLYKISRLLNYPEKVAKLVCLAYIFNPVSLQLTAIQGQYDQFVFLFVLLAAYIELSNAWNVRQKTIASALALVLATYFKPYTIFFIPVFFFRRDTLAEKAIFSLIFGLGCFLSVGLLLDSGLMRLAIQEIVTYPTAGQLGWGRPLWRIPFMPVALNVYAGLVKPIIIAFACYLGYVERKKNIVSALLIITLVVYVLNPTLASQYLYWAIPLGVIFRKKWFYLYSVFCFIWQLNHFQYTIVKRQWYGNYLEFVPLSSIDLFYNPWLLSKIPTKIILHGLGDIVIPAIMFFWLISLFKMTNLKINPDQFFLKELSRSIFNTKLSKTELTLETSKANKRLLILLMILTVGWLYFTFQIFQMTTRQFDRSITRASDLFRYPKDTMFQGNKIEQYFVHGRNETLIKNIRIKEIKPLYVRVQTPELYKVVVNDRFVRFEWSPEYGRTFGTNRVYKKETPLINIEPYLKVGENTVQIVANFSFDAPSRIVIQIDLLNESGKIISSEKSDFAHTPRKPFYLAPQVILAFLSIFYYFWFLRIEKSINPENA